MHDRIAGIRDVMERDLEPATFTGVLVVLELGGRQVLLLRLGADGGVHRLGSGSLDSLERDRFIGTTTPDSFLQVCGKITPQLLHWCGQPRCHPAPRGEVCDLLIAFKQADGQEQSMVWEYGSLSKWPPPEVLDFVAAALEATRPWYEEQKRQLRLKTQRAEYEWWRSFTVPHA